MDWLKKLFSDAEVSVETDDHLERKKPERKQIEHKQSKYDAKSLTTDEDRPKDANRSWFAVDPDVIYPVTISRIQEVLAADVYPEELSDPATDPRIDSRSAGKIILNDAKRVSEEEWDNALKHRQSFDGIKDIRKIELRAFALDVARRWFTQALHVQVGGDRTPMGLHILENKRYKS